MSWLPRSADSLPTMVPLALSQSASVLKATAVGGRGVILSRAFVDFLAQTLGPRPYWDEGIA